MINISYIWNEFHLYVRDVNPYFFYVHELKKKAMHFIQKISIVRKKIVIQFYKINRT